MTLWSIRNTYESTCHLFIQIDLPLADAPKVIEQLNNAFGFDESDVIQV